jgi:Ca2+-binding RTX toxin-like protein
LTLGGDNNDVTSGSAGDDNLNGQNGADTITGGAGRDTLTGGALNDVFDFNLLAESGIGAGVRDVITDFSVTYKIDLSTIDAIQGVSGNQAFTFIGTSGFTAEGQVRLATSGTSTIVQANFDGTSVAEMEIQMSGNPALVASNFIL